MHILDKYKLNDKNFFRIGVFLLASAPLISSSIFLLILIWTFFKDKLNILKDKNNLIFVFTALLMIIISFIHIFHVEEMTINRTYWDDISSSEKIISLSTNRFYSLMGLFNWIPLFFCFFGFQKYLNSIQERKIIMKIFVAGSVPVLVSGFGQYWFNWHGPLTLLNGLIIWFQKPSLHLAGLFSNQNYTGCWLNIVWPFAIAIFLEKTNVFSKKGTSIIFIISIALASILTSSRNAWGGLFLTLPILLSTSYYRLFLFGNFLFLLVLILLLINFLPENISTIFKNFIPEGLNIFSQINPDIYPEVDQRSTIIIFALRKILENPILGYGAASFPIYYLIANSAYKGSAHNLIINLAFNYGIIIAILIFTNIFIIFSQSFKKIFLIKVKNSANNYFERAWWTSFFILFISQMVDVQYYDIRISITFWLLLSGLKCIISNENENMICTN